MSIAKTVIAKVEGVAQGAMEKAIEHAPDRWMPGGTPDPLIAQPGLVGQALSRLDGPLKVAGTARFAAEFEMRDMLFAALAYSTIAKGRIAAIDTRAAERADGVALVMTHLNAPAMKTPPLFMTAAKAGSGNGMPVMQSDRVEWNGQPVALVLARTQEKADHAKSLIRVTYAAEPATTRFYAAKAGARPASFQCKPLQAEVGDAEAALRASPVQVDEVYPTPRHNYNALKLHAATVAWKDGELVMHDCVQGVSHAAWSMAQVFDLKEEQVHVTSPFVGGGFGGKTLWQHQILAAAASKLAGKPVRMVLSREGVYRVVGGRTLTEQRVALGAGRDGRLDALLHTGFTATTPRNALPEPFILQTMSAYSAQAIKLDVQVGTLDMVSNTFMRASGESVGTFALESAIDELADKLGLDPIQLRLRNEPEKDPLTSLPFSSRHIVEAWRTGRSVSGGTGAPRIRDRGATASGWWAWAARPRPIRTTACRAARPGSS